MRNHNPLLIPKNATQFFIDGPQGKLYCLELKPTASINNDTYSGVAIIFHPNPIEGGSYTNKVVQTIAKTLNNHGYLCICPNLRGVGLSEGVHDNGISEVDDAFAIYTYISNKYPELAQSSLILAGFSFGSSIASKLATKVDHKKLILVGIAVTRYKIIAPDSNKTIIIHGEEDEIIPIANVFDWSRTHNQPIIWVPNTGHFFHGKLSILQNIITNFIN